jgi:phage-related baseplate assembly protein
MHEACWAAHVAGRTRALAAAQLCAVQASADAGFTVSDGAAGVWNALSGCVQGLAMADLLDDASLAVLLAPWELATGEPLLRP